MKIDGRKIPRLTPQRLEGIGYLVQLLHGDGESLALAYALADCSPMRRRRIGQAMQYLERVQRHGGVR